MGNFPYSSNEIPIDRRYASLYEVSNILTSRGIIGKREVSNLSFLNYFSRIMWRRDGEADAGRRMWEQFLTTKGEIMHILVVEDEQRLAYLLRRVLLEERHTVDLTHDGESGLDLALSDSYEAVILDRMLPGMDGLEICRQMRAERIMTPVLMLTVSDLTLDLARHEARRAGRVIELTAKEFALLEYLMRHPGQALTRTQIVDAVWRYDMEAISNVVDIYIHYLRDKIDQGFSHRLIKTVRGVGYKIEA